MAYTLDNAVTVSTVVDGQALVLEYSAGDSDLAPEIAALLVAQGLAAEATGKKPVIKPTVTEADSEL